jgi:hypothetical protein
VEEPEVIKNVEDDAAAIGVHLTPTFVFIATWENASAYSGEIWEVIITFFRTGNVAHAIDVTFSRTSDFLQR